MTYSPQICYLGELIQTEKIRGMRSIADHTDKQKILLIQNEYYFQTRMLIETIQKEIYNLKKLHRDG